MGICETRLGHFQIARALLDKAKRACIKECVSANDSQEEQYEAAAASVFVALSELYSAQGEYEGAVDCLERAWVLKDEELGSDHPQARDPRLSGTCSLPRRSAASLSAALADPQGPHR